VNPSMEAAGKNIPVFTPREIPSQTRLLLSYVVLYE
jgi:hypothetical protein